MIKFRSIQGKIVLLSGICLAASIIAVIAYSTISVREIALSQALAQAKSQATIEALRIRGEINSGLDAARNLAYAIEGLKRQTTLPPRRDEIIGMIGRLAEQNENFLGVWTGWEPNAFDGQDEAFINGPGSTSTGRFLPYWNKVNGLHLQAIVADPDAGKWYTYSRDTGMESVMDPIAYEMQGQRVVMISLTVPIKPQNKVLGVASIDIAADFLQNLVDSVHLLGHQADVTLITHNGAIAGKTNHPEFTGKPLSSIYSNSAELLQRMARGSAFHVFEGGFLQIFVPVTFGEDDGNWWGINISISKDLIYAESHAAAIRSCLIGGICMLAALGFLWFIAGVIARPIKKTASIVDRIAAGDLEVRLAPNGRDEIAVMQASVNTLAVKLQENIEQIENQICLAREKTHQAEQATSEAEEAKCDAEKAHARGMTEAADKLQRVVARLTIAMKNISEQAEDMRQGTETQKERITTTATAMEEMNATVLEVARNAGTASEQSFQGRDKALEGARVVKNSIETLGMALNRSRELHSTMAQLDTQAKSIGTIMTVIDDIADQTNLLALNAAIEAARAGDAGRGFAVVADEVRKLAEKTMHATKEVGISILAIQKVAADNVDTMELAMQDLDKAVGMTNQSGEVLRGIVEGAEESADRIREIATAAEQQSAASEEINQAIDEINGIALEGSHSVGKTLQAIRELSEQSSQLTILIRTLQSESATQ
ncbi:MAG: methyl-accepting chemotaxis protein [Desulfovibrio sp.]|uniref:methyl-accepting chemotaxis protein n=1 Tax=Desulfovibrio sp. 7SRBS1 TaxID=3378064 RepID=UPI003B4026D0